MRRNPITVLHGRATSTRFYVRERSTIRSRAVWGTGADAIACEGSASFSARERD
jgi:hypothetical protein